VASVPVCVFALSNKLPGKSGHCICFFIASDACMAFHLVDVGMAPCLRPGSDLLRNTFDHVPVDVVSKGFRVQQVFVDLKLAAFAVSEDVHILSQRDHL
jgi:hypothetical protein